MPSGEVGAVGAGAAWLQKGCLEFSLGSRHHPHLENCRASSRQGWEGWEGASNRDAGTLTYGFFARKQRLWLLGGGQGGWRPLFWGIGTGTEEQINPLSATAAIVAKLTLELTTSTRVSWGVGNF